MGLDKYLGLATGFPVAVRVDRATDGTMGIYTHVNVPLWLGLGFKIEGGAERCAFFEYSVLATGREKRGMNSFKGMSGFGRRNFFGKPWKEVVCPNSPHFPNGVMAIEITMEPSKVK